MRTVYIEVVAVSLGGDGGNDELGGLDEPDGSEFGRPKRLTVEIEVRETNVALVLNYGGRLSSWGRRLEEPSTRTVLGS
jgi:hypothetical protein